MMDNGKYRKILEALIGVLDEGVHIVDADGVAIFYNRVMAKIEQVKVEDIIGNDYQSSFPDMHPDDSTIYHVLRHKQSIRNRLQTYVNLSGKRISTINTTIPVLDGDDLIAAIEVANDITQLSDLSDKIMQLQEESNPTQGGHGKTIKRYHFSDLIGESEAFLKSVSRAKRAARSDAPVFIYGETGTGKELFAQSIHYGGQRASAPFLAQNCAALPADLLEGILFGTAKGGFTGAVDRAGLFEQASGGTLLLDELNSMPYELQSKLLRVLQESYVRRVGGMKDIPVDVRIIATVNEDPRELIEQGVLRQDLYYRLSVVNLEIPPLRERKSDIPYLAEALRAKHCQKLHKELSHFSRDALRLLMDYDYPGNVRELENIVIQAIFMADEEKWITSDLINIPKPRQKGRRHGNDYEAGESLTDYLERTEKAIIQDMFDRCSGNVSQCASALHIKRQTLQHKLKKYGILI